MPSGRMLPLVTVSSGFAAKVLAARLGSEGMVWELRGNVDGPYPVGDVEVLVAAQDLHQAQELLLADEIESSYDDFDEDDLDDGVDVPEAARRAPLGLWLVLVAILSTPVAGLARLVLER